MRTRVAILATAVTIVGAAALAHNGATGVVKERMDGILSDDDLNAMATYIMDSDT
jgi:hypothetical protein